jgi:hypothetical protein
MGAETTSRLGFGLAKPGGGGGGSRTKNLPLEGTESAEVEPLPPKIEDIVVSKQRQ